MADNTEQWEDNISGFSIFAGKKYHFMSIESVFFARYVPMLHQIIFA